MDEDQIFAALQTALTAAHSPDGFRLLEPLLRELWSRRNSDRLASDMRFESAEALGAAIQDQGGTASTVTRQVLSAGRALVDSAAAAQALDLAAAQRLHTLIDEAATQAAQAVERARRARRQMWLSYLAHEFKNPLNTVLNALWLLRERAGDPKQNARFTELAERAVRRLEARILDMRALDEHLTTPPPGWQATPPISGENT